jgi:ABC-2 type transport system ATP-binding protein
VLNTDNNELLANKIENTGLVNNVIDLGGALNLSVDNPHTTLPRIVEFGVSNGIYIESISIIEPDMEDVFIHYTGHEIREESAEVTGLIARKRRQMK